MLLANIFQLLYRVSKNKTTKNLKSRNLFQVLDQKYGVQDQKVNR